MSYHEWYTNTLVDFVYTGSVFTLVNGTHASVSYYGSTILSSATNSTSDSVAATSSAVKSAYDLANTANTTASTGIVYYGTCSTADSTQTKEVTISGITELFTGLHVRIKFTNAQTYNGAPKLKINSLSAVEMRRTASDGMTQYEWSAGTVMDLVYDGTAFVAIRDGRATTTYLGITKLSNSVSSTSTSLAATANSVKTAYDLANSAYHQPYYESGSATDIAMRPLVDRARANRLAFLPANQIIIEKTTDGGTTWVDAEVSDSNKIALFDTYCNSPRASIPLLNGEKSTLCGVRITITAMTYDVPSGTTETQKYNYWNSSYATDYERYAKLDSMWFWINSNNDAMRVEVEGAKGNDSNSWETFFNTDFPMKGWTGQSWVRWDSPSTFGGNLTQVTNYWNYRITFWSRMNNGASSFQSTASQSIWGIQGFGAALSKSGNNFMMHDHLYGWDSNQNATFPANVTATNFIGTVNGYSIAKSVPSDAVFTDHTYDAATANPIMDGSAAVGSSAKYAREDHVHPSDTSRIATSALVTSMSSSSTDSQVPSAKLMYDTVDTLGRKVFIRGILLPSSGWSGSGPYTFTLASDNIFYTATSYTKADVDAPATTISQMITDGIKALYIDNTSGTLTMVAVGATPSVPIEVQVTLYETMPIPIVTAQASSSHYNVGDTVLLSVTPTSEDYTYRWEYSNSGGATWTNGSSTSDTYSWTGGSNQNGRWYRCRVTNSYGTAVSNVVVLSIG